MASPDRHLSTLELAFLILNDRPDWPVVQILVDGREAFVDHLLQWRGFDPADMLGDRSPLLPHDLGRRVAVYRCSCGIEGCGVVAPIIVPSPDGRSVSWVDFRDYVGVFTGPTATAVDRHEGRPWPFPDLHFDRDQYLGEVRRATADRSWETPRRATARLVADGLRAGRVMIPTGLRLGWAAPPWDRDGVEISLEARAPDGRFVQHLLSLTSSSRDPDQAARDILDQLDGVPSSDWTAHFGRQPR